MYTAGAPHCSLTKPRLIRGSYWTFYHALSYTPIQRAVQIGWPQSRVALNLPIGRVADRDRRDRSGPAGPPFGPLRSGPTPRGLRTEFTYLLSFIRPRNPQLAVTLPRHRLYIITFFVFFQQGVSSSPAACVLYCFFPSLITSISHHLCLVLFFFNQQCGKVQCAMRNAGDW